MHGQAAVPAVSFPRHTGSWEVKVNKICLMKKMCMLFMALWAVTVAWGQAPQAFRYQAVARNAAGEVLANQAVSFRISVLRGSATGTAVYSETHSGRSTNAFGLVELEIGKGVVTGGSFAAIPWDSSGLFLKVEMDPAGGSAYRPMGGSLLLSVPYALHAKTVEVDKINDADADPANEIQLLQLAGSQLSLSKNGGTVILPDADAGNEIQALSVSGTVLSLSKGGGSVTLPSSGGGDDWGTQSIVSDATLAGQGTTAQPLKMAQQSATAGQVLKWDGTTWKPADDATGTGFSLPYVGNVTNPVAAIKVINYSNADGAAGLSGNNPATSGTVYGVLGTSGSPSGYGIFGTAPGCGVMGKATQTSDAANGVRGETSSPAGVGVYGENTVTNAQSGSPYGVYGKSSLTDFGAGVFGESPHFGVQGKATGSFAMNGVRGECDSMYGTGVSGFHNAASGDGAGVKGTSVSASGTGVIGEAPRVGVQGISTVLTGSSYGIRGETGSSGGIGVYGWAASTSGNNYGVAGKSASTEGYGVWGNVSAKTGINYGVYGSSESDSGFGVYGYAMKCGVMGKANGLLGQYGVMGECESTGGYGVYGYAKHIGVNGTTETGTGVYGHALSTTGINFGVIGKTFSPSGFSGYFQGGKFYVQKSVGIGTEDPTTNLSLYDPANTCWMNLSNSKTGNTPGLILSLEGDDAWLTNKEPGNLYLYAQNNGMVINPNGNVGIGGVTPSKKLDVAGAINIRGEGDWKLYCKGAETIWYDDTYFSWGYGGNYNYFADNVTIGTSSVPGYNLVVAGTAAKTNGGSWSVLSDLRLKDLKGEYLKGLDEIIRLKPVRFTYKPGNPRGLDSGEEQIGFVAQEVREVFPEAVKECRDGYLDFNMHAVNVALVNAVKQLKAENDRLSLQNAALTAEQSALKARLDKETIERITLGSRLEKLESLLQTGASAETGFFQRKVNGEE